MFVPASAGSTDRCFDNDLDNVCLGAEWTGTSMVITLNSPQRVSTIEIYNSLVSGGYARGTTITAGTTLCETTPTDGVLVDIYTISCPDVLTDTITIVSQSVIEYRDVNVYVSSGDCSGN